MVLTHFVQSPLWPSRRLLRALVPPAMPLSDSGVPLGCLLVPLGLPGCSQDTLPGYVRNMHVEYLEYVWDTHGIYIYIYMEYGCNMYGICMEYE